MTKDLDWQNVTRVAWLAGGLVAVSNSGAEVQIGAGFRGRLLTRFTIPTYHSLLPVLQAYGFRVIGVTFISAPKEALGLDLPEFRASTSGNGWLVEDARQSWRQITHASSRCDKMRLADIAARIAAGMAFSQQRLLDLADAYSTQLRGRANTGLLDDYCRFRDTNSISVYMAIHALFWELAVLRDVIAEFAAEYCFKIPSVDSWRGLMAALSKNKLSDELADKLESFADAKRGGWIAHFTAYRNLFTHSAPMDQVLGSAFTVQDTQIVSPTLSVPRIYYPLPPNAYELKKQRSESGTPFKKFQDFIDHNRDRRPQRDAEPDALDYLRDCLEKMAGLAELLARRSPIEAGRIEINEDELIGGLKINGERINLGVNTRG